MFLQDLVHWAHNLSAGVHPRRFARHSSLARRVTGLQRERAGWAPHFGIVAPSWQTHPQEQGFRSRSFLQCVQTLSSPVVGVGQPRDPEPPTLFHLEDRNDPRWVPDPPHPYFPPDSIVPRDHPHHSMMHLIHLFGFEQIDHAEEHRPHEASVFPSNASAQWGNRIRRTLQLFEDSSNYFSILFFSVPDEGLNEIINNQKLRSIEAQYQSTCRVVKIVLLEPKGPTDDALSTQTCSSLYYSNSLILFAYSKREKL